MQTYGFLMQDDNNASFGLVMTHDLSALLEQDRLLNMDYHCGGFYEEVWPVGRHKDGVYKYTNKSYWKWKWTLSLVYILSFWV